MEQQNILAISTMNDFAEWLSRKFIVGEKASKAKAIYMFANKPGTDYKNDGDIDHAKFNDVEEAKTWLNFIGNMKFVFESKPARLVAWVHNEGTEDEYTTFTEMYGITAVLSVTSEDTNKFVAYCPCPYKNV